MTERLPLNYLPYGPIRRKFADTCPDLPTALFQTSNSGSIVGGFQVQSPPFQPPHSTRWTPTSLPETVDAGTEVSVRSPTPSSGHRKQLPPLTTSGLGPQEKWQVLLAPPPCRDSALRLRPRRPELLPPAAHAPTARHALHPRRGVNELSPAQPV